MEASKKFEVNVVYGTLNYDGSWTPNPNLEMTADEQYAACKDAIEEHRIRTAVGAALLVGLSIFGA